MLFVLIHIGDHIKSYINFKYALKQLPKCIILYLYDL